MFDLEKAIKEWKRSLRKNRGYEDGDIEELESHLRDRMDDLINAEISEKNAFETASEEIGNIDSVASELHKTRAKKIHWEQSSGVMALLPNYVKIAWRNFTLKKSYSIINVLGLSVGLAACLLIAMYVQYESSYDKFHENSDRSYRVLREFDLPDLKGTISYTPSSLAVAASENLPGVQKAVRVQVISPVVAFGVHEFVEPDFLLAEEGFFDIFSFEVLKGTPNLDQPNTILITENSASKYFGDEDPIGKTLSIGNTEMEVTGVLATPRSNSHIYFDFIASLNISRTSWGQNNYQTYLLLHPDQQIDSITEELKNLIASQIGSNTGLEGDLFIPHLQPISDIHLGQGVSVEIESVGNIQYLYLFTGLAIFILILASINYMNLATARSMERAREVGLRKTIGGSRTQIAFQFLGESALIALIAALFALLISYTALPFLNNIAGTSIAISDFVSLENIVLIILVTLLTGLLSGGYPALILSHFQPSRVLKSAFKSEENSFLRKGLIVFQFTISIALLAGTAIIYNQIQHMKSTSLGFNPDNILLVKEANFLGNDLNIFMNEIKQISGVESVSSGFSVPGSFFINSMWQPDSPNSEAHNMDYSFINFNYIETLELEVLAGRVFSESFESDSFAVVINEAAAKDFGWTPEEAIQHKLLRGSNEYQIIGVLKDFNYRSLHSEVYSLALFGPRRQQRYVTLKVNPETNLPQVITNVQEKWEQFSSIPLDYSFLADDLQNQYEAEDKLVRVFGSFAGLAIFIGILGLFGLASFTVAKRTKEIGIRKVLGASTPQIVSIVSIDLLKLVGIGFLIATPTAWFFMNEWLKNYAYKTDINWWIFPTTGILALFLALATVSGKAIRAAQMNPVKSLKSE
ncbi:MAG: ABC transporter permease [Balneolaceae bacterium]|nr:ABC transporter permease [Balneolaceae bacterium]MBO6546028.1 ABC transporter permease [Balneolaceae bacterium]MBO6647424.1 ABC transporter permease [Balneolaceae bacterium]